MGERESKQILGKALHTKITRCTAEMKIFSLENGWIHFRQYFCKYFQKYFGKYFLEMLVRAETHGVHAEVPEAKGQGFCPFALTTWGGLGYYTKSDLFDFFP